MPRPTDREFEQLVREHHAAVYRSARRFGRSDAAAADVAQEVFLRLLRGKVALAGAVNVRATLCWLATRLAQNGARAARRRTRHEEHAMNQNDRPAPAPSAAAVAAATELHQIVNRLVLALPAELRLPLQLRCEDGLTFAAIGSVLALSESAAHERCERALARLRGWLSDRGILGGMLGAAGTMLPEFLGSAPLPAAPRGLEVRLLALGKASAAVTFGVARRVAVLLVAATAAVAVTVASALGAGAGEPPPAVVAAGGVAARELPVPDAQDPPPVRVPVRPAVTPPVRPTAPAPVAAPQDPPNSSAGSVFRGTVRDSAGAAVANVRVDAIAGGGLKPFELGSTTTDRDGAFRLALERGKLTGMARQARLRVREGPLQLFESEDYSLPRAADAEPVALVLPAGAGTEATRFTLRVGVHDAAGAPIAGAEVRLHPAAPEPVRPDHGGEVEARTDAAGEVVLRGRVPGPKRLWVDARAQGGATSLTDCEVERASDTRLEIRMPEPATLRGTVTALAGPLPEHLSVWLEDRNACLHRGELGARGEVEFRGLLAVPHTLHVRGWPISPVERAGLVPGAAAFRVELKRNDDPRDVGDHMAELHGRVVDAATGETLPLGGFEIHVHRREFAGDSTLATDGCPPPPPVQTAAGVGTVEQFHETGLAAGRWVLTADVSGYAASAREFTLADGELVADLEIALQRGATLSGRVLDDRGAPVKSALVCLLGVGELPDRLLAALRQPTGERRSWPCVNLCAARSRPDGTFELTGVPPDLALRVVAWKADLGLCAQAPNVYRAGAEVSGLELRLQRR